MKRIAFIFIAGFLSLLVKAQNPDLDYNPYVNSGIINPSPLLPLEVNGTGVISFNIGNTGSDPLYYYPTQYITLTITLSYGEADNIDPLAAVGGSASGFFDWTYNAGTYTALQNTDIPGNYSGTITIDYRVTQNSAPPLGYNGFNVNIAPAPYQTESNSENDDAVSSYTYTEIRDYSDAPASYGTADHNIDFENYLGALVDGEAAAIPTSGANGDDLDGTDDEDGVTFPADMHREENVSIPVVVTGIGRLNAWIDWNGDGDFSDAGERIADNILSTTGTVNLPVTIPADAIISGPTYARFRFSYESLSTATGSANTGEVEDYQVSFLCAPPVPVLTIQDADSTICAGTSLSFNASGGTSYNFRVNGSSAQDGPSAVFTTTSLTDGALVDVIVTDDINCAATSDAIPVNVNPLPVAGLTSSDTDDEICEGTSVSFTASGGTTYNFRIDGSSVQNEANNEFTTSGLTNNQVVDVIVTDLNGCEATSTGITTTVNPLPIVTLTIDDDDSTFCAGTTVSFNATGGNNYNFRVDGVTAQNGISAVFTTSGLTNNQVVDVIVTNNFGCQETSGEIVNTVIEIPTADAGTSVPPICQGGSTISLGGSVGGSATGGYWSTTAGGSFSPDSSALDAFWIPPADYSGTATLVLTTTGSNCGTVTDSKTQLVNPTPVVAITNPDPVCSPETVDLTDVAVTAGSTPGLTFSYWTDAAGTINYPTPTTATAGTYYIRGTSPATGCSDIKSVIVTVNETPATPVITVVDNCDGSSVLSTNATGSLLWNTGATTPEITVYSPGSFTVTSTIDGCTSAAGTGDASPLTAPSSPVVSNTAPENLCPDQTVDLTALVTSTTPAGGSIFYKVADDPLSAGLADPSAVTGGTYYLFYQDVEGCYSSGTAVTVTINTCPPDLTPTLIVNPNIMHGVTSFNLTVRVTELNLINTSGTIIINIPKDSRWIMPDGFDQGLTIIGSTALDNADWSYSEDAINHIFSSDVVIPAGGSSTIGFRVTFNPGSTRGFYTITSQIVSGGGGEVRVSNNSDSESIDYFQE